MPRRAAPSPEPAEDRRCPSCWVWSHRIASMPSALWNRDGGAALTQHLAEGPDRGHVCLRRGEAGAHAIHGHVCRPQLAPRLDAGAPFVLVQPLDADPGVDAELLGIATGGLQIPMELIHVSLHAIVRRSAGRHPAVPDPRGAPEHGLRGTPEPDGDGTLDGQRIDPGIVNHVVRALVRDERVGPELAEDFDLLFDAAPARLKRLAERVVLDVVPANPNAKAQAASTQDVDLRGLLGHEDRLTLRQDENAGDELEPRADCRKESE